MNSDSETWELDEIQVEFAIIIAEQMRINRAVEKLLADGERPERTFCFGHPYILVGGVIQIELTAGRIAPDIRRPNVRYAWTKDNRTNFPVY